MEAIDIEELHHPERFILKSGGAIIVAMLGEDVIGTCALVNNGNRVYEMVKMAVDDTYRVMEPVVSFVKELLKRLKSLVLLKLFFIPILYIREGPLNFTGNLVFMRFRWGKQIGSGRI